MRQQQCARQSAAEQRPWPGLPLRKQPGQGYRPKLPQLHPLLSGASLAPAISSAVASTIVSPTLLGCSAANLASAAIVVPDVILGRAVHAGKSTGGNGGLFECS